MSLIDINLKDLTLIDSATTHTILKNAKYFSSLVMQEANVQSIFGCINLIEGSIRHNNLSPKVTKLYVDNHFILPSLKETCYVSRISTKMDIIQKQQLKKIRNIFRSRV